MTDPPSEPGGVYDPADAAGTSEVAPPVRWEEPSEAGLPADDPVPASPDNGSAAAIERLSRFSMVAGAALAAGAIIGLAVPGPFREFMAAALMAVPFAILGMLAYAGLLRPYMRVAAFLWLCVILGAIASAQTLLMLVLFHVQIEHSGAPPPTTVLFPAQWRQLGAVALWGMVGICASLLVLTPMVRRRLAGCLPIDPGNFVHAIALSLAVGGVLIPLGQLLVLGEPLILALLGADPAFARSLAEQNLIQSMLFGLVWAVPAVLVATGYPVVRTLREALQRVGMVVPTWPQVLAGLVIAALLAGAVQLLDLVLGPIWRSLGLPETDTARVEQLFAPLMTPVGAVVIAVVAGVEEEIVFRGALQPRLGILLSNLLFAIMHAWQYSWDGLLVVFLVGLALAVVRKRTNTTTAAIVHGAYDFILVMGAVVAGGSG
jgi:membrane protease YdiL (CAAX protease family)